LMASSRTFELPEASTTAFRSVIRRSLTHDTIIRTDVEAVWVLLLELLPLRGGVFSGQGDVLVGGVKALSELNLGALRGGNRQLRNTRLLAVQGR
jgi:hypothetical protein